MTEGIEKHHLIEKIGKYDAVEILINDNQEMIFEGIIDPVYIQLHFERILNSSKNYNIIKLVGYHGKQRKEMIAEVFVSK